MARYSKIANTLFMARMTAKQQLMQQALQQQAAIEQQRQALTRESLAQSQIGLQEMNLAENRRRQDRQFALELAKAEAEAAARAGKARPTYSDRTQQAMAEVGFDMSQAKMADDVRKREQEVQDMLNKQKFETGKMMLQEEFERPRFVSQLPKEESHYAILGGLTGDFDLTQPGAQEKLAEAIRIGRERYVRETASIKKQGATNININKDPPTTSTRTKLQGRIFDVETQKAAMDRVAQYDPQKFLGYLPKFRRYLAKEGAQLGAFNIGPGGQITGTGGAGKLVNKITQLLGMNPSETREFLSEYQAFKADVDTIFNDYRRMITGAAAADSELQRLQDQFMNMAQDPVSFGASQAQWRARLDQDQAIAERLLAGFGVASPEELSDADRKVFGERMLSAVNRNELAAERASAALRKAGIENPTAEQINAYINARKAGK